MSTQLYCASLRIPHFADIVRIMIFVFHNMLILTLLHNTGKTTLISMLAGIHTPTSGDAIIEGNKSILTDMDALRRDLGVCTQHNALFDTLTVQEHLKLYA